MPDNILFTNEETIGAGASVTIGIDYATTTIDDIIVPQDIVQAELVRDDRGPIIHANLSVGREITIIIDKFIEDDDANDAFSDALRNHPSLAAGILRGFDVSEREGNVQKRDVCENEFILVDFHDAMAKMSTDVTELGYDLDMHHGPTRCGVTTPTALWVIAEQFTAIPLFGGDSGKTIAELL